MLEIEIISCDLSNGVSMLHLCFSKSNLFLDIFPSQNGSLSEMCESIQFLELSHDFGPPHDF